MIKSKKVVIRYSTAFKHQVIKEIEEGRRSIAEARRVYGIGSANTILYWMERMGRFGGIPRIVRVEKPEEKKQIKELQRQIKELKEALAETQVHRVIAESRFEVVCEEQGLDPEEVKKKTSRKVFVKSKDKEVRFALLCRMMNRSRQSYYKARKAVSKKSLESEKLLELVRPIRKLMPRLGGRKIHFLLQQSLAEKAIKIGRDRLFKWLRHEDLLVKPKRSYVYTTQSNHRFWVYDNLAADLEVEKINQLWVSDITYLRTQEGFCYLALITDAYSRKIVGYDVSDSLELEGCKRALDRALQTIHDHSELIHHSDRGIQYCSNQYTAVLKQRGIKISMATAGNCYENALAERVNGILKGEFNLDVNFRTKALAIQAVHQSVYIYNQHRPHLSLDLKTPVQMHAA